MRSTNVADISQRRVGHLSWLHEALKARLIPQLPFRTDIIVKSVNEHLISQHGQPSSSSAHADDRGVMIAAQVARIDVHKDRLIVRFKSAGNEEGSDSTDAVLLSIPWQKPPSRKSRQILIPLGVPR